MHAISPKASEVQQVDGVRGKRWKDADARLNDTFCCCSFMKKMGIWPLIIRPKRRKVISSSSVKANSINALQQAAPSSWPVSGRFCVHLQPTWRRSDAFHFWIQSTFHFQSSMSIFIFIDAMHSLPRAPTTSGGQDRAKDENGAFVASRTHGQFDERRRRSPRLRCTWTDVVKSPLINGPNERQPTEREKQPDAERKKKADRWRSFAIRFIFSFFNTIKRQFDAQLEFISN